MASSLHVPAWRRIGLKLKHESNDYTAASPLVSDNTNSGSNKRSRETSGIDAPDHDSAQARDGEWWKRRKQEEKRRFEESVNFTPMLKTRTFPQLEQQEALETKSRIGKDRKSVSFARDTKANSNAEIGETSGSVEAESAAAAADDARKRYVEYRETVNAEHNEAQSSKVKKPKRKKGPRAKAAEPTNLDWHPKYLEYLKDFYHSRDTWKFNKAKQTHLLRHVFDLNRVPWTHSNELGAYLAGLKGASIRQKLSTEAARICEMDDKALNFEAMDESPKEMTQGAEENAETISRGNGVYGLFQPGRYDGPTAEDRKREYEQALRRYKRELKDKTLKHEEWDLLKDPEWKQRLQTRMRAEQVLWRAGEPDDHTAPADRMFVPDGEGGYRIQPGVVEHESAANGSATNGKPKRKRKRKRRTGVPDDDTSSDETSSSESDDEEDPKSRRRPASPISVSSHKGLRRDKGDSGESSCKDTLNAV